MIRIGIEQAILLHEVMAERTGGDPGIRDIALLDSALSSAYQTFGGEELYPTLEEKAARLGFSLISNHPFVDGNKRIGMYVMLVFLEVNGVKMNPSEAEVIRAGLSVAASKMTFDELLLWINENRIDD